MIDLTSACNDAMEDVKSVQDWCDDLYTKTFSSYFSECRELFDKLKDVEHAITDSELSFILMTIPVTLFDVAEEINNLRIHSEVIKLKYKEKYDLAVKQAGELKIAKTAAKDYAEMQCKEYKLLSSAYATVISRAESEVSFCKELIMSAKKIWDARRRSEQSNPVTPKNYYDLPEYPKSYIK